MERSKLEWPQTFDADDVCSDVGQRGLEMRLMCLQNALTQRLTIQSFGVSSSPSESGEAVCESDCYLALDLFQRQQTTAVIYFLFPPTHPGFCETQNLRFLGRPR